MQHVSVVARKHAARPFQEEFMRKTIIGVFPFLCLAFGGICYFGCADPGVEEPTEGLVSTQDVTVTTTVKTVTGGGQGQNGQGQNGQGQNGQGQNDNCNGDCRTVTTTTIPTTVCATTTKY
jgi:hypothetical protein